MGAALVIHPLLLPRRGSRALEAAGRRLIRAALQRRTPHERRILSLVFYDRLTAAEAAAALGLPPGEATRTVNRVLAELSVAWQKLQRRAPARAAAPRRRRA